MLLSASQDFALHEGNTVIPKVVKAIINNHLIFMIPQRYGILFDLAGNMKLNTLLLFFILPICTYATRPSQIIHSYKISLAEHQDIQTLGYAVLKLDLVKGKHYKQKVVDEASKGLRFWKKFSITSNNGRVSEGLLYPDFETLPDSGIVHLNIRSKYYRGKQKSVTLRIPVLERIEIVSKSTSGFGPGSTIDFAIQGFFSDGRSFILDGSKEFYGLKLADFNISVDDKRLNSLSFNIPGNYTPTVRPLDFKVEHKRYKISGEYFQLVDYKLAYSRKWTGNKGPDGLNGQYAKTVYNRNGNDGQNGDDGARGEDGQLVRIYAMAFKLSDSLVIIKMKVKFGDQFALYTVNSQGGSVVLSAKGGQGGTGGSGGHGGDARLLYRSLGYGVKGGNGGNGGRGGNGGNGGQFVIFTDSASIELVRSALVLSNPGGEGGAGGQRGGKGFGTSPQIPNQPLTSLLLSLGPYNGKKGDEGEPGSKGNNGPAEIYNFMATSDLANLLNY